MRFLKPALALVLALAGILLALGFSSISSPEHPTEGKRDWIADVYDPFDTLRTDPGAYRWPTDATTLISSGFGEFRRSHFHAGIDISTRGQQGYRVFASRDGYVSRLSVSATGYGLFLDVRHPDGFTSRYAHLQRFNDTLDAFIRLKQLEAMRYAVDVRLDSADFPVRAGAVLAYSGETGIGAPHLHFEIRDDEMNPINPLRLTAFRQAVHDDLGPTIRSVAFEPLDYRSSANGSHEPLVLGAVRAKDSRYRLPRAVRLSGTIGLSVSISDPSNGTWHKSGPYRLTLTVDDSLIFQSRLDQFDAAESDQVALHYNWPMLGRGRFQNLYVKVGNRMPLYGRLPEGAGIISHDALSSGRHLIKITASDFHGNESHLWADVDIQSPNNTRAQQAQSASVPALPDRAQGPAAGAFVGSNGASDEESAKAEPTAVRTVIWQPELLTQTDALTISKEFYPSFVLITLTTTGTYTLRPSLRISSGGGRRLVDIDALDSRHYAGAFPLDQIQADRVRIEAYAEINGSPFKAVNEFTLAKVEPGRATILRSPDGKFSATFGEDAVYEPLFVQMEQRQDGYALEPRTVLLKGGAEISMTADQADPEGTLGLYLGEEWNLDFTGQPDPEHPSTFTTHISRMLGPISIHRDSLPPTISQLTVRPSRRTVRVDFRVWDDLSGVRSDDISVKLDGAPLIPVYDPYSRSVSAEAPLSLGSAQHSLSIRVVDRNANAAEITRPFSARRR